MNSKNIIIAILIFIKVIGVASHAKANYFCNYSNNYGDSYDSYGISEYGKKSIQRFFEEATCNERQNERQNDFYKDLKDKGIL